MPITYLLGLIGLTATFNQRLLDPLTPLVAQSIGVHTDLIVLLAPALTLPFAIGQPILGPIGDAFGKARLLKICAIVLALSSIGAALAPNYAFLFVMRMLSGVAAGGMVPTSVAIIADRFPVAERQVAMGRFMMVMMFGQLLSAPISAGIAEAVNWNAVMFAAGLLALVGFALAQWQLKPRPGVVRTPFSVVGSLRTYGAILSDSRARICYLAVAAEGLFLFGFTPHVALYLGHHGYGGIKEAGYVLAAQGLGGLVFVALIGRMARRFSRHTTMRFGGAAIVGGLLLSAAAWSWPVMALAGGLMGFGFYLYHSGLQTEITEVLPSARASAVSLHAFFMFLGMAIGPVLFGWIESAASGEIALVFNGVIMLLSTFISIAMLEKRAAVQEA